MGKVATGHSEQLTGTVEIIIQLASQLLYWGNSGSRRQKETKVKRASKQVRRKLVLLTTEMLPSVKQK